MHSATSVIDLSNEGIQIQQRGILSAIAGYFNEKEASTSTASMTCYSTSLASIEHSASRITPRKIFSFP